MAEEQRNVSFLFCLTDRLGFVQREKKTTREVFASLKTVRMGEGENSWSAHRRTIEYFLPPDNYI